ncbi:30S ribosomal protein S13 [Methanophagales archaeon]|nr:MAG: 30S ribosomal protein S13 [Methanophagales archaeon]
MSEEGEKTERVEEEEFKHIVRILDTDLDGNKRVAYSLCGIKGVGRRVARAMVLYSGVDMGAKMGKLSNSDIEKLKVALGSVEKRLPFWMLNRRRDMITGEDKHIMGSDMALKFQDDINLLRKIRSYRGIRHERGLKVRGQRTKSTGRRGLVVGVVRKKLIAKLEKTGVK